MGRKCGCIFILSLVIFCACTEKAPASDRDPDLQQAAVRDPIDSTAKLIVGHDAAYLPYYYTKADSDGTIQAYGFIPEVLKGVARLSGIEVEFKHIPGWTRLLKAMENNQIDAMFPLFKTPERETYMIFSDNAILAHEINIIVSRKDSDISFSGDLHELDQLICGVIKDYSYGALFDKADYLTRVEDNTESNLLKLLLSGNRYDVVVGNKSVLQYVAHTMGETDSLVFHDFPLSNDPLYISFNRKRVSMDTANTFSDGIAQFMKTEEYQELKRDFDAGIIPGMTERKR